MAREYNYVAHDCRNSRLPEVILDKIVNGKKIFKPNPDYCDNRWIGKDLTNSTTQIPTWAYCESCCKKLGINFEKQKPSDYRTNEQQQRIEQRIEKLKMGRNKQSKLES